MTKNLRRWSIIPLRKFLSRMLLAAGVILVLGAFALEAYHFPWGALGSSQAAGGDLSIPDPTPIVLKQEDQGSLIVEKTPAPTATAGSPQPSAITSADVLPGQSESDAAPPESYIRLGILKIPKLELSEHILDGTDRQLMYGVGHVAGTADPGQQGNCAIAGHNTSSFRHLDLLKTGDSVLVKVDGNLFSYTVYDQFTVLPDELWVLDLPAGEDSILTLITCTPYLISSHRLIVRARLATVNDLPPEDFFASQASG